MHGFNVLHPMGWDAFGLPAERAAVRGGRTIRRIITQENINISAARSSAIGFSYDWKREFSTTDEDYYKLDAVDIPEAV
jgi:leucyl-tRNA synthetase